MHYTVEALLQGKEKVLEYFEKANEKWKELFEKAGGGDAGEWSDWIAERAPSFEEECGGRLMAPEIMAFSAFGLLYSIQFGWRDEEREKARRLLKAIDEASVGEDIKTAASKAAAFYALKDEQSAHPEAA